MQDHSAEELNQALRAINSIIHKCEKAQEKFPEGSSHHTLLCRRLKAMYISEELITQKLLELETAPGAQIPMTKQRSSQRCEDPTILFSHLAQLHTTDLGAQRIRKNLHLNVDDVVAWCREQVTASDASISRKGKNWYILVGCCEITVNAHSYTIITAHQRT